jgi:hypothetical protein
MSQANGAAAERQRAYSRPAVSVSGLPTDDAELLAMVKSDLAFLEDKWDQSIDEQSLRRSSTVLRNLLVYDGFGKAWRLDGRRGEPQIEAVDLNRALAGLLLPKVAFATAGGALSQGMEIAAALVYLDAMSPEVIKERFAMGPEPPRRQFKLSEFLASAAVVVDGVPVNRRNVIQYVANKLGGAHFDVSRKEDEEAYGLLDRVINTFEVAERRSVYFELLSIGQALAGSGDAKTLRELIVKTAATASDRP